MTVNEDVPKGLRLNALGGAEIVCGRFRNQRIPKHNHDGLMLSAIDDGVQCVRYRGKAHLGGRGAVIAIPPQEVHAGEPYDDDGWHYRTITIPTELIRSLIGVRDVHFHCTTVIADDALAGTLAHVFDRFSDAPILELEELLQATLNRFITFHARTRTVQVRSGAEARAVAACKAYLASRMDQNVHLAELEAVSGIDRFRLVKCFSRLEGLPPHAWHLQHRVGCAQDLLSRGEPVSATAYATGFADQAHLTRAFKRLLGLTPARYRRSHLSLAPR